MIVDTRNTTTSTLLFVSHANNNRVFDRAYKELKFIVNVRVVENRVKSHVGKVYDIQKRTLGSTPNIDKMTRPSKPNVEVEATRTASGAAPVVRRACSVPDTAAVDASTRDVAIADAAMVAIVEGKRGLDARLSPNAVLLRSTVVMQGNNTHVGV